MPIDFVCSPTSKIAAVAIPCNHSVTECYQIWHLHCWGENTPIDFRCGPTFKME